MLLIAQALGATAGAAEVCGLRTQIDSNCWIRGLTASEQIFLFRGRDVAVTMNSVKLLHAVRSAITAIAELLVKKLFLFVDFVWVFLLLFWQLNSSSFERFVRI